MPMFSRPLPLLAAAGAVALLAACAGGEPVKQEPADPAMLARLDKLANHGCNDKLAGILQARGVQPDQVQQVGYVSDFRAGNSARLIGYYTYITIAGQPGKTVVQFTPYCLPQQVFVQS